MKFQVENLNTNYSNNRVTCSVDFIIQDDTGFELWRENVSSIQNITVTGWYPALKAELLTKCQVIKDAYVATITTLLTDTGQADRADIELDITNSITGGII